MPECGYPSVYVVDTHATGPPVPPRLRQKRQQAGAQTLLFLLVSLALAGIVIEACLIFRFHRHESAPSGSSSMLISDGTITKTRDVQPSKPVAHLTDGQDVVHKGQVMAWSVNADPILFQMDYKDRSLIIQKEGFYHVYSKVSFFNIEPFHHAIHVKTKRYKGKSIPLLVSRANSELHKKEGQVSDQRSNSYLGGVFHFYQDDAIFVKVSNSSQIVRFRYYENIFGAFML